MSRRRYFDLFKLSDCVKRTLACALVVILFSVHAQHALSSQESVNPQNSAHVSLISEDGTGIMDQSLLTPDENPAGPTLTIRQLFELGGQPIGPWPEGGLIWPYFELMKRVKRGELDTIVQTASSCLFDEPALENSHAFCAFILAQLNPVNIDDIFTRAFSDLNALGQFEVAIYAYTHSKPDYAPLLAQMVNNTTEWSDSDKRSFVAASFAMHNFDASLHAALISYQTRFQQQIANYLYGVGFRGFSYSDAGGFWAESGTATDLFNEAISFGNSMIQLLERGMTNAEQQWLSDYHDALENVERIDLPLKQRSLRELIAELNTGFRTQKFAAGRELPEDSDPTTHIGGSQLSATEILSTLCNRYGLNAGFGSYPDAWHIGNPWVTFSGFVIDNPCAAYGRYLAILEPGGFRQENPRLSLRLHSDSALPPAINKRFDWQKLVAEDGVFLGAPARFDSMAGDVTVPTSINDIDNFPAFSIHGTIGIMVPKIAHQLERIILPSMKNFRMSHDRFELRYEENADNVHVVWGAPRSCCVIQSFGLPTQDNGIVTAYNAAGQVIGRGFSSPLTSNDPSELNSNFYLFKSSPDFQQPTSLEWTIAPAMERYSFDIKFEDVRLISLPAEGTELAIP